MADNERNDAIRIIKAELKRRSGKTWSVTGGKGTSWGWITITSPPARRVNGCLSPEDQEELRMLLGVDAVHHQGEIIPASRDHRIEYIDRARGRAAKNTPAYWD